MRKLILPVLLLSAITLNSCGGDAEDSKNEGNGDSTSTATTEVDTKGLREFDMSEYDLNVILYIPEKFYTDAEEQVEKFVQPVIVHNDGEALWDITLPGDKHFHMVIEDWGDIPQSIADEKVVHLDNNGIYDYVYNEESENSLLFSRVLKSDNTTLDSDDMKMLPNHHFYVVKNIDGYYITAKSYSMQDFHQISARTMMRCALAMRSSK